MMKTSQHERAQSVNDDGDLDEPDTNNELEETGEDDGERGDDEVEAVETFEGMNLRSEIFRGLLSYGFERPSVIQQKAIPAFINHNRDIIAQAQSGTGKTATFSVALLQKIEEDKTTTCQPSPWSSSTRRSPPQPSQAAPESVRF